MRHLTALTLAAVFTAGAASVAFAGCPGVTHTASNPATVASADQATSSTKVTIPESPKSGS